MSETKSWVNGKAGNRISVLDRGLLYGHTVFETIRISDGKARLLPLHLDRLQRACDVLLIPLDLTLVESEVKQFCAPVTQGVVRLTISIGTGGRGYATPADAKPIRILTLHPLPDHAPDAQTHHKQTIDSRQAKPDVGLCIGISEITLSGQPLLAGIKHGNRLEQVLIRQSWGKTWQEALVLDQHNSVIEGTHSNVFIRLNNQVVTPSLDGAGVAGVMRQFILDHADQLNYSVEVGRVTSNDIALADELLMCNSVVGAASVATIIGNSLVADKTFSANEFKLKNSLTQLMDQHGAL